MTENAIRARRHQPPNYAARLLFQPDLRAPGQHIGVGRAQREPVPGAVWPQPLHHRIAHQKLGILGNIKYAPIPAVDGIMLRLNLHPVAQPMHRLQKSDLLGQHSAAGVELLSQHIGGKSDRAAGVFFLADSEEVGGKADLRLHFLLAIAVIVIGDQGHNDPARIPACQLKRPAAVVRLLRLPPTHTLVTLPLAGVVIVRQSQLFFRQAYQMRRQNHATRVPSPMHCIQRRIVFRQVRIAGITKNALHKI